MEQAVAKSRNHAIDILKFIAAILITNSHMKCIYPDGVSALATGGAIGDSLFFFCSGFLLMMGKGADFFNWYKRRINRIFPSIFAVALISIVVFGRDPSLKNVILRGGGWFVQAIFVFYAVFWFVKRFLSDRMWIAYLIDAIIILVWFIAFWNKDVFILYNGTYLRWPGYFMLMLMGASVYKREQNRPDRTDRRGPLFYIAAILGLIVVYYGYQLLEDRLPVLKQLQLVLLPLLMCIVMAFYRLVSNPKVLSLYGKKYIHWPVYYISACCLEIYLCGNWCFGLGEKTIRLFPLNVILTFLVIFVVAYIVKMLSNFLSQTFKSEPYDWSSMVKL